MDINKKLKRILYSIDVMLLEIRQNITPNEINKLKDKELKSSHTSLHGIWAKLNHSQRVGDWTERDVKVLHTDIVKEMIKRKLQHNYLSDLDDTLPSYLKTKTQQPNISKLGDIS